MTDAFIDRVRMITPDGTHINGQREWRRWVPGWNGGRMGPLNFSYLGALAVNTEPATRSTCRMAYLRLIRSQ